MSKVIILNGPAGCGKDTVGMEFANREGFHISSFKEPMFRVAAATLGMDYDSFYDAYQDREWKESPNEKLNGHTVRELMIQISESFIKPFMGEDYFGQQAAEYIRRRPWADRFIFTDGGFTPEVEALVEGNEVIMVHMYRDGCTFEGDSRSYVLTNSVPRIYTLTNNGTVQEAVDELGRIFDNYEDSRPRPEPTESDEDDAPVARPARARRGNGQARWVSPTNTPSFRETLNRIERERRERTQPRTAQVEGFRWDESGEPVFSGDEVSTDAPRAAESAPEVAEDTNFALNGAAYASMWVDESASVSTGQFTAAV